MTIPTVVESLVRRTFGSEITIVDSQQPGLWAVARIHLTGGGAPTTVIAKWLRSDSNGFRIDPVQVRTEAVALDFVNELAPGLAPALLASDFTDPAAGVLLLEDLAPRQPLDDLIRRTGAGATTPARRAFARALGELHAATADHEHSFVRRLSEFAPVDVMARRLRPLGMPWPRNRDMTEQFGVLAPTKVEEEMAEVHAVLGEPGPFLSLSNGDTATNNFLVDHDDGRIIDFEFAGYDHALASCAGFYVPGPPWIVVNDPIAAELEQEFRTALARGVPAAEDDALFDRGIAAGCVAMALDRCGNLPKMDARPPGETSRAQRVATLESAAAAIRARRCWPAIVDWMTTLAQALRKRWPDADVDFEAYGPYTRRS